MFLKRKKSEKSTSVKEDTSVEKKQKLNELKEMDTHLTSLLFQNEDLLSFEEEQEEEEEAMVEEVECVWNDPYLEEIEIDSMKGNEYEEKMRRKFLKNHPNPKWIKVEEKNSILTSNEKMMKSEDFKFNKTMQIGAPMEIEDFKFHPSSNMVALCYGSRLQFHKLDQENVPMIEKFNLGESNRIQSCCFLDNGNEMITIFKDSSEFSLIDLTKGIWKKGNKIPNAKHLKGMSISQDMIGFSTNEKSIEFISSKTKFKIGDLKLNENVNQIKIHSNFVYASGAEGNIYIFDVRTWKPLSIFQDFGSNNSTCLDVNDQYLVTGSSSGVVNVYVPSSLNSSKKPFKSLMNLTTSISQVKFNHQQSLLSMVSKQSKNGFRLINIHSQFETIPEIHIQKASSFQPTVSDFSFTDEFYGIATEKKVKLYQLKF
jgi:U3 small nucleolar RNA-associated protein 18